MTMNLFDALIHDILLELLIKPVVDMIEDHHDMLAETRHAQIQELKEGNELNLGRCIGSGLFASVYENLNDKSTVIKYGDQLLKDGWIYYALECIRLGEHAFPFMPKIHGLCFDLGAGTYYAVMEKLTPVITQPEEFHPVVVKGSMSADSGIDALLSELEFDEFPHAQTVREFIRQTCIRTQKDDPFRFDAHTGNWMRRENGDWILTDPFAKSNLDATFIKEMLKEVSSLHPDKVVKMATHKPEMSGNMNSGAVSLIERGVI